MSSFHCPHNTQVHIKGKCCITECPYHTDKVETLFTIENKVTNCSIVDSDIMANVSDSRTQISSLARDPRRKVSPKLVRSIYDDSLAYIKTLYDLTHEVASFEGGCSRCGYPNPHKGDCVSRTNCNSRLDWVKFICSLYSISENGAIHKLIWDLLLQDRIHMEAASKDLAHSLCSTKHRHKLADSTLATVNKV